MTEHPLPLNKAKLIDNLLANDISLESFYLLRDHITPNDLSVIIQRIYDLNEDFILKLSAVEGLMRKFDDLKNTRRNRRFMKKINSDFRASPDTANKIILVEGDSWFNYPVVLTDIVDAISMDKRFAVYSIARGGDWLLNMLHAREYVEELSLLHPDFFLLSAGGNDLVGAHRLAAIVERHGGTSAYSACALAQLVIGQREGLAIPLDDKKFRKGIEYISKDFYALLMFFHLQYFYLMRGILEGGRGGKTKFPGIQILTQGYDYPIPNRDPGFGFNPFHWYIPFIRLFLGNGGWLKTPLQMRGIVDKDAPQDRKRAQEIQEAILYAMIYMFNEMVISLGAEFNKRLNTSRVFHIDSRGSVGKRGWADELHARPKHFLRTGEVFRYCIGNDPGFPPTYEHVYVVNKFFP